MQRAFRRQMLIAIAACAAAVFCIAEARTPESHGKLSVKLDKRFTVALPAVGVTWSPDSKTLGVSSNSGMTMSTFDRLGHRLTTYTQNGSESYSPHLVGFLNGVSQTLAPLENNPPQDAAVDIRDVATGQKVKTITRTPDNDYYPNTTGVVAVSPDQTRLATGGSGRFFVIYHSTDGKNWTGLQARRTEKVYIVTSLCFFPDGKLIAVGMNDGQFSVVDSITGKALKEFKAYDEPGIDDDIGGIAVNPQGTLLLTGLNSIAMQPPIVTREALAWEKNRPAVIVWRVSDGEKIAELPDKGENLRDAVWDPKDRFVAFADSDGLVLWQPQVAGKPFVRFPMSELALGLAISPDGESLAVTGENDVTVYTILNN